MATDPNLEAKLYAGTPGREPSVAIDAEAFDYDFAQHSNGATFLIKGVTAEDLRGLASGLMELAEELEDGH